MAKKFACDYPGCTEAEYHRHCVRCPNIVTRRGGVLCSAHCRKLDTTWRTSVSRVLCEVRPLGQKERVRKWLPSHLVKGSRRGPK